MERDSGLTGAYFARISLLGFGFTALATSFTIFILPARVLELAPEGSKNTHLAILSFTGLLIALAVQPLAGGLSDRTRSRWGRRRPFILAGVGASLPLLVAAGLAPSYATLFALICVLQVFSNSALGPYQALLRDLVPRPKRGAAAGMKTLVEVAGAMGVTAVVGLLMGQYEASGRTVWLWASMGLLGGVLVCGGAVTVRAIPERNPAPPQTLRFAQGDMRRAGTAEGQSHPDFKWFLVSRLLIAIGAASLQSYALFFFRDFLQVEHPSRVVALMIVIVGGSVLVVAYPAGIVADRIGRKAVMLAAGVLGAAGAVALIGANTTGAVLSIAVLAGVALGMFLGANWAMATDLVSSGRTAQQLGLVNIATAAGAGLARLNGIWVDGLNGESGHLGYSVLLGMCAILFLAGTVMVLRVRREGGVSGAGSEVWEGR